MFVCDIVDTTGSLFPPFIKPPKLPDLKDIKIGVGFTCRSLAFTVAGCCDYLLLDSWNCKFQTLGSDVFIPRVKFKTY